MATHSSILAWKILWIEEPGKLQSMGWREALRFGSQDLRGKEIVQEAEQLVRESHYLSPKYEMSLCVFDGGYASALRYLSCVPILTFLVVLDEQDSFHSP